MAYGSRPSRSWSSSSRPPWPPSAPVVVKRTSAEDVSQPRVGNRIHFAMCPPWLRPGVEHARERGDVAPRKQRVKPKCPPTQGGDASATSGSSGCRVQPPVLQALEEGRPRHAQLARHPLPVVVEAPQRTLDDLPLQPLQHLLQRHPGDELAHRLTGRAARSGSKLRSATSIICPFLSSSARCTTFRSSRMLPGHPCCGRVAPAPRG